MELETKTETTVFVWECPVCGLEETQLKVESGGTARNALKVHLKRNNDEQHGERGEFPSNISEPVIEAAITEEKTVL